MVYCRYVGNDESQVGDREFAAIGEIAMFSEALFIDAVRGGASFILEDEFKKIGFSAQELAAYGHAEGRDEATSSFNEKVEMAQQVFRDRLWRLSKEGSVEGIISEVSGADGSLEQILAS